MRKQMARCLILAVAGLMLCAPAHAGALEWDSYAVKFACGNIFPSTEPASALGVKGKYLTSINIHNTHYLLDFAGAPVPVQFFKKVVLAQPQGAPALPPSCLLEEIMLADHALSVNCANIKAQLALSGLPSTGPQEGFLVLLVPPGQGDGDPSPPELDVTALYTARFTGQPAITNNGIRTWDVESVDRRRVRGAPTLVLCD